MNPANAWLLLTTRSIGVELTGRGYGALSSSDVAIALKGLGRGPFLLGMATLAGDESVKEELTRYVHIEIVVDLANVLDWQSERGDQMWRRLAALAVFELLNGQRCMVCNGKGQIGRELLRPTPKNRQAQQRERLQGAIHRLLRAQWIVSHYEKDAENMAECGYRPTERSLLSLRRARYAVERIDSEIADLQGMVKCMPCRGTGKAKIGEMHRAWAAGISRKSWHGLWTYRYAVIQGELRAWSDTCLEYVCRFIDGRNAA